MGAKWIENKVYARAVHQKLQKTVFLCHGFKIGGCLLWWAVADADVAPFKGRSYGAAVRLLHTAILNQLTDEDYQ